MLPDAHRRRSIRLPGYDYRRPGHYFVTICTARRRHLLGSPGNRTVHLSAAGRMVAAILMRLPSHLIGVEIDGFAVMPDHVHLLVFLDGTIADPMAHSLADVVHRFKSFTTARYRDGVHARGWPPFPGRLWHRNYYESIIRDARHLAAVRRYVALNPERMRP